MPDTIPEIRAHYDSLAPGYDAARFRGSYGRFLDKRERRLLQVWLTGCERNRVLDLACGTGRMLRFAGCGVDFSAPMIAEARRKLPSGHVVQADARRLPFTDGSMQAVLSFHLAMHLPSDALAEIGREVWRVLEPGGQWIVDFPSATRRRLSGRKRPKGWHGNSAYTMHELVSLMPAFRLHRRTGILWLPIHRIPDRLRMLFLPLDALAGHMTPSIASYQIVGLVKPSEACS